MSCCPTIEVFLFPFSHLLNEILSQSKKIGKSLLPENTGIHCTLAFPPSAGLNIPFLILWIECEITIETFTCFLMTND